MCSPTPASTLVVAGALSSGRVARHFLEEHWCHQHSSAPLDQAKLLLTELVTNAVRHAGPPILLRVECVEADGVVLSVSDGDPAPPVTTLADPSDLGGRGVHLVDLLSRAWGVDHHPDRGGADGHPHDAALAKTVWCRLSRQDAPGPGPRHDDGGRTRDQRATPAPVGASRRDLLSP
ncbi:ATP-binding protein [Kineococcus sp. TBRC 1896]|uniref:ATP-binding protein n=1 Tax=Kineococcus mangrovi TaxID=1660183 RepID=A0ABV4I595_9ACTN